MTLGVDVGGTFTDLVWWDGERLRVAKTSTTLDQSLGVVSGAAQLTAGSRVPMLVHGTTVATNALLERQGARVALVTDPGFEDLIEIARQDRPSLYDHDVLRPEPLVPRSRRFGHVPDHFEDTDVAVVSLLGSYADPSAERRLASLVAAAHPDLDVIASSEVSGEFREFERLSTTVLTGYLRPVVDRYLERLDREVRQSVAERLLVMQSSGGLVPASAAGRQSASILLSGPAGGVVAAAAFGDVLGHPSVISFDMGGTSTDVCRIEGGRPEVAFERTIEGYACRLPSVAVHTVGAGGGSVGWVDAGGALRVGPRSAGAAPGPAAYGRGGLEATVTDADLLVGRLSTDVALADDLLLDVDAATAAMERLGARLGLSITETSLGIVEIVEAHMERAIRRVSVEEGFDPSGAALVAFGGAGGMHASALASRLGMGTVLVPPHAGVLSALGLLLSPTRIDVARTILVDPSQTERLSRVIDELTSQVTSDFQEALGTRAREATVALDMRYIGQSHETTVPWHPGDDAGSLVERFHAAHDQRNGFRRPDDPVEVVTVRATAVGSPTLSVDDLPSHTPIGEAVIGERQVRTVSGVVDALVYRRDGLAAGTELRGPAVVVEEGSTTWLEGGMRGRMHESGTLVIESG